MENMKSVQFLGPKTVAVVEAPIPEIPAGWALIKVSYAGVCGSDLNIFGGTHPRAKAPLILGHEFTGTLEHDTDSLKKGTPVTVYPLISCGKCPPCLSGDSHVCNSLGLYGIDAPGGMARYVVVPQDTLVELPKGVSLEAGALIEPIAVVVHAVRETGFIPGDNALVFGAGPIGLSLAIVLRLYGARGLFIAETDAKRLALAKSMGFETVNPTEIDIAEFAASKTGGNGFDRVYDCAGVPAVSMRLLDVVRVRGQIVIVAGYKKNAEMPFYLGMVKEPKIEFVRVYRRKDFEIASDLIVGEPLFNKLITHVFPPEKAQEGFELLTTQGSGTVKVLINFD